MNDLAPPPYSESESSPRSSTSKRPITLQPPFTTPQQLSPQISSSSSIPSRVTSHRFPPQFGIYHTSGSNSDNIIALHADNPPLYYVSTHTAFSSQPSVVLHSGPNRSYPPLATADFHSFGGSIDIALYCPAQSTTSTSSSYPQPTLCESLEREGTFTSSLSFYFPLPPGPDGRSTKDLFIWKSSSGNEVAGLNGRSHGMKLVRERTGQVVAAWARPNMGLSKKGKMEFLGEIGELGEGWEVMAVISVAAIMEKMRRRKNNNRGVNSGAAGMI